MKNTIKCIGIIAMVMAISFIMIGCASNPPPQDQIRELELNNGIYGPLKTTQDHGTVQWFKVQPSVTGELVVETFLSFNGYPSITLEVYDNDNRRISRVSDYNPRLVIQVEAGKSYLLKVKGGVLVYKYSDLTITTFNEAQREEAMRLAEEERLRVEAERAETRRQAELVRQEQQQAEQTRLANLYRQAGNNFGNLSNTSVSARSSAAVNNVYGTIRYDFGDGNYMVATYFHVGYQSGQSTGTFRVNGDTVIFLSSEGVYSFGTILGNTLTIENRVFR